MRRRWVRRALGGAVVLGLAILAVFFNHPAAPSAANTFHTRAGAIVPGYSTDGTLREPSDGDVKAVVALLDTRARAVLDGDEAGFMGVVDTDRRAFAQAQRVVWANTRQLPVSALSFTFDGLMKPDAPLDAPTFLARITTTYQLAGFDTSPVVVDDGFSFVQQHGTWKLAGVSDADGQLDPDVPPVPWDGAAITAYGDGHYLAVVDHGQEALARRIVALCRRGTRADAALLGVAVTRPTVVLATSTASGFEAAVRPDAEAVTYPLTGPEGVTPGWRVMVNPDDVDHAVASPVVLPHELTHLATQDYLAYLPRWLSEGAAEYVAWHSQGGLRPATRARGYDRRRTLPDHLPTSSTFYRGDVQLHYLEGMALVAWIAEHRGPSAVRSLMRAYADAGAWDLSYDADTATPQILDRVLGMSPSALAAAGYADLNAAVPHT